MRDWNIRLLPNYCDIEKVIYHPYRKARTARIIAECQYKRGDSPDIFREELAKKCDGQMDNHTVYEVWYRPVWDSEKSTVLYFGFSDWTLYIGLDLNTDRY